MAPAPRMPVASQFVLDGGRCPNPLAHPACTKLLLGPWVSVGPDYPRACVRESRTLLASARVSVCINAAAQRVDWWRGGSPLQRLIAASLP